MGELEISLGLDRGALPARNAAGEARDGTFLSLVNDLRRGRQGRQEDLMHEKHQAIAGMSREI